MSRRLPVTCEVICVMLTVTTATRPEEIPFKTVFSNILVLHCLFSREPVQCNLNNCMCIKTLNHLKYHTLWEYKKIGRAILYEAVP